MSSALEFRHDEDDFDDDFVKKMTPNLHAGAKVHAHVEYTLLHFYSPSRGWAHNFSDPETWWVAKKHTGNPTGKKTLVCVNKSGMVTSERDL